MYSMKPLLKEKINNTYTWSYKFDTDLGGGRCSGDYCSGWWCTTADYDFNMATIPFWFPKPISIQVNWGDGTIETIQGIDDYSNRTYRFSDRCIHTYNERCAEYTISITSSQWENIWLCGGDPGNGGYTVGGYPDHWFLHSPSMVNMIYDYPDYWSDADVGFSSEWTLNGTTLPYLISGMRMGCTEILNPLPKVAGIIVADHVKVDETDLFYAPTGVSFFADCLRYGTLLPNSMYYAFAGYVSLSHAPVNLFENNANAVDFTGCLWCTSPQETVTYDHSKAKSFIEVTETT